jgi:adenylate kinase
MDVFVFLGPAGSGKGTQAHYLKSRYGTLHLSTGDMLRDEVNSKSSLGQKVKSIMASGNLVSDEIIIQIIREKLSDVALERPGIVLDGFPRTIGQARALELLLEELNLNLTKVIYFDLSLDESIKRISGRRIDTRDNSVYHLETNPPPPDVIPFLKLRDDDNSKKVTHRYEIYRTETQPLIEYFSDKLITIDCTQSISSINLIFDELFASLDAALK